MPVYLRESSAPYGGPDGKGWNRLSLNAHGGLGAQCALRPRCWGALLESKDTRRARWGGFDRCINRGQCDGCPVLEAWRGQCTVVPVNAPRVLVRVEPVFAPGTMFTGPAGYKLWLATGPDDRDYRNGQPWTWDEAARVRGWDLGRSHLDEHGEGFWLERTTRVPAWGCTITGRTWPSFSRHAIRVERTRVALLHCVDECTHDRELLNAISHACPGPDGANEERVPVSWRQAGEMTPRPAGSIRFAIDVWPMRVRITAIEGAWDERAWLTLTGSGWTAERVRAAADALRSHFESHLGEHAEEAEH